MSGTDDLRSAIEDGLSENVLGEFVIDPATVTPIIDVVMQVLADPALLHQVLEATGNEVYDSHVYPGGFVVRPRGETTDV